MRSKVNNLIIASIRDLASALADDDSRETHLRILTVETFLKMAKRELRAMPNKSWTDTSI